MGDELTISELIEWWEEFNREPLPPTSIQALRDAKWYWVGYLTALRGETPSSSEVTRRALETWKLFLNHP